MLASISQLLDSFASPRVRALHARPHGDDGPWRGVRRVAFGACAALAAAVSIAACGTHGAPSPDGGAVQALDVEPAQAQLALALGGRVTQVYQVFGVVDGERTDVTSSCQFSIDPTFGAFSGATAAIAGRGGKATVTATCAGRTGSAELVVSLAGQVVVGASTPPEAPGLFAAAAAGTDATRAPTIEYPIDHAVAPRNFPAIEMQWKTAGDDLFHVALHSTYEAVDVYTSDPQAKLGEADWNAVAATAAGDTLSITVEGLSRAAPQQKFASAPTHLVVSNDTIDSTAIYYWASSRGSLMKQTFGATSPPSAVDGKCTSCHSVSRSGTRIAYSRCVDGNCDALFVGFLRLDPATGTWREVVNADDEKIPGSYSTFAPPGNPFPGDEHALAMVQDLRTGTLNLYDPDTGAPVASNLAIANDTTTGHLEAMMPDWSPDGGHVVYVQATGHSEGVDVYAGQLATMSYHDVNGTHVFGEPKPLVTGPFTLSGQTYANFFLPSYSPDGAYVVFDASHNTWTPFAGINPKSPRLMLTDAAGSRVVDLTALDGGPNTNEDITWPHWAPGATSEYDWVVFSSERDYGHEITGMDVAPGCQQLDRDLAEAPITHCKQLWIGAISKAALAAGTADPSAPPMWLPGQDPQADNVSPYWSPPPAIQ